MIKIAVSLGLLLASFIMRYIIWITLHLASVKNIQMKMIKSLFKAKVFFFDVTPTGRILNRFSVKIIFSLSYFIIF